MLRGSLRSSIYHRLLSSARRTFEAFQAHLISISRNTRYSQSECQITQVWPLEDIVRNTTMPQVYPPRLPLKLNEWMTPQLVNPAYRYHNSCSGSFRLLYQVPRSSSIISDLTIWRRHNRRTLVWLISMKEKDHHTHIYHWTWLHNAHAYYSFLDTSCWLLHLVQLQPCYRP